MVLHRSFLKKLVQLNRNPQKILVWRQLSRASLNVGSVVRKGIINSWAERHNFCWINCFMASVIMSFYVLHVYGAADASFLIKVTDISG